MAVTKKKVSKKKVSRRKSVAKTGPGKELATMSAYEQRMAEDAMSDEERLGKSGESTFISIKDKEFTFRGADLGEVLEVVIVNFASGNFYYDSAYDPNDQNAPACCAIGLEENDLLVPFEDSPDIQSDNCEDCEYNEWGSADVGNGKKCTNRKIICVVHSDTIGSEDSEYAFISIPPTSMGNFNKYIKGLSKTAKRPSYGVITEISFDDEASNEELKFKLVEKIETPAIMGAIMEQREACIDDLTNAPDFSNYHKVEKKPRRSSKKKVAKKRASRFAK